MHKLLLAAVMAATVLVGPISMVVASPARVGAPMLVIAPPWHGGAAGVLLRAGLNQIGPSATSVAILTDAQTPQQLQTLRSAGAWMVLDGAVIASICGI